MSSIDPLCEIPTTIGCSTKDQTCSPIFSTSEIGDYCRQQFATLTSGGKDTVIENYCLKNEHASECKCVNRILNPDYNKLKIGNPYSDACWYIPCANRNQYFIPSEFDSTIKCPQNICQIVYNISEVNDVDLNHIKNDINCDFSNGGVIPDPTQLPNWIYVVGLVLFASFILIYSLKKK